MRYIIILLVFLILINGCAVTQREVSEGPEPIVFVLNESAEEEPEPVVEEEEPIVSCEEWAESLFPEQWVFNQDVSQDPELTREVLGLRAGEWSDGSTIKGTSSTKIEKGSETGENINYYYTKPIFQGMKGDKYGFLYSDKVIDEEGNVLGENSFKIRPVFRVIHDTTKDELNAWDHPVKIRYLSLVIKEPGFVSCEKVD